MKNILFLFLFSFLLNLSVHAQIKREPGLWKSLGLNPAVGRVIGIEPDPNNPDRLYAVPDASGVWLTENLGRNWRCITDNIPVIEDRLSDGALMVDPDDFQKLYYVSNKGGYYISSNAGKEWLRVKDSKGDTVTLTDFKRSIIARDHKSGKLIMVSTTIGTQHTKQSGNWKQGLHTSRDGGITWKTFPNPSAEESFLEVAFHPTNPRIIYAPTTHRLYKSTDGGETFVPVYDFPGPKGNYSSVGVARSEPDLVYLISCNKSEKGKEVKAQTGIYKSANAGKTWEVIQDGSNGLGYAKSVFSGSFTGSWLNNFAVNPNDPNQLMTAEVSMSESKDGGKTWNDIRWGTRSKARMPDGGIMLNKYANHIADNQCLKFHPATKERLFKACDAGLYVRDPEAGFDDWVDIGGEMLGNLFYSVRVNEFGDRYLVSNLQDVNVQTYQYGEWQWARGYEGDVVMFYPYTNFAYFPYCGCDKADRIQGLNDKGMESWGRPQVAVNYKNPDEGYMLYQTKIENVNLKRVYKTTDRGKTATILTLPSKKPILYINVSRTDKQVVTAVSPDSLFKSENGGLAWTSYTAPSANITFGAVDPREPDHIWLGSAKGQVFESLNGGRSWDTISRNLPKNRIEKLLFHEGSQKDLYVLTKDKGIFYRNENRPEWVRWMGNFSLPSFSDMIIDYPSQKLVASSYGRGLWEADLQNCCERFLGNEPQIKKISDDNGPSTFTIDHPFFLPDYYDYKWEVNGIHSGFSSMYFTPKNLKHGDIVSCRLGIKNSPDMQIEVKDYKVRKEVTTTVADTLKNNMLSSENGSADIGYYDYFVPYRDFTIELMVKPETDGVIMCNRRKEDHDAKGWILLIENSKLILKYAIKTNPVGGLDRNGNASPVPTERIRAEFSQEDWNRIALVFRRDEKVELYVNGEMAGSCPLSPSENGISLNSLFNIHLFADVFDNYPLKGCIDNIKIWSKALDRTALKETQNSTVAAADGLLLSYDFNASAINGIREYFTGNHIKTTGNVQLVPFEE